MQYQIGGGCGITRVHSLVIGSGAAGLNAAAQLVQHGVRDVLILTEGLAMGTSINTGSDKQTYYKLSLGGAEADSPRLMAEAFCAGGSMHGDLALVEASLSARAFLNLVNQGVPFPHDRYGQFVGYKTDHDPRQRATSIGPYTSREMCRALIRQVRQLGIEIYEGRLVIQLVVIDQAGEKRVAGALALNSQGEFEAYLAENVILAVGGPGGLYQSSVYPEVHSGAIGVALRAGVCAQNLPESQFGLASMLARWNVSGSYLQAIPRLISRGRDGDEAEFLPPFFSSAGEMNGRVFLKGYQWPFDARKVIGGSSLIDLLVHIETALKGRQVFLDFRQNPQGFSVDGLPDEAREYLEKSQALQATPIERLQAINPAAVEHYREHGLDLALAPLEVAVCAQHNNGGLAGNLWWESINTRHLFPVGEVNGSHGVARPGGSALNAGQVGGLRAAEYIAQRYAGWDLPEDATVAALHAVAHSAEDWVKRCRQADVPWTAERAEIRERMSRAGAQVRSAAELERAVPEAWRQVKRLETQGCRYAGAPDLSEAFQTRQLCLAQAVYLDALYYAVRSGVGSRGSAIVLDTAGQPIHPRLAKTWTMAPEDPAFRTQILETVAQPDGHVQHTWVPCRPIPAGEAWFETTWAQYRAGAIYDLEGGP